MKKYLLFFSAFVFSLSITSQTYKPAIDSLIQKVNQDSLASFVRILSGEDSVYVNGQKVLIKGRVYDDNDLAEDYLFEKLTFYGLSPVKQSFRINGTNVYATKYGTANPDEYYLICAHYDAVTDYCADDNGSGTATVLEAARLMSTMNFSYSLVFAFWDEEEIGLFGSAFYAWAAAGDGMDIRGVVNIDMIGWDSDNDGLVEIHSDYNSESMDISDTMIEVNSAYGLSLLPAEKRPGTGASDHASFWDYGYGAVLLIEGYWSGDFNPYYHSTEDRISRFNIPYFHKAAQLAIGSTATLAVVDETVNINNIGSPSGNISLSNYPNPCNEQTTIAFNLPGDQMVQISLLNGMGQPINNIVNKQLDKGKHRFQLDTSGLPTGIYVVLLKGTGFRTTRTIVVAR
ncbi:MAG: M28 family peptidase [Bacteroidales bacterium]|nr:M28 family peptidase [Bacteroidales bacterium]